MQVATTSFGQVGVAVTRVVARQEATIGVCQNVHREPRVAVVGADPFDQLVQAPHRPDVVEAEVIRIDVEVAAAGLRLLTAATARISAGTLQRDQHLPVEIAPESFLEDVVGLDVARLRLERHGIDFDLETAVVAGEQFGRAARPDLPTGPPVAEARAESARNHHQRRLIGIRVRRAVERAERRTPETRAAAETEPGRHERAACPAIHA